METPHAEAMRSTFASVGVVCPCSQSDTALALTPTARAKPEALIPAARLHLLILSWSFMTSTQALLDARLKSRLKSAVRASTSMTKQRRPEGTLQRATVEWKREVRAALQREGVSRTQLAKAVRVSPQAISELLGRADSEPEESASKLVDAINEFLGIVRPVADDTDDELRARVIRAWPKLDANDREMIRLVLERVRAPKP